MEKVIIGNWKMNPASKEEALELFAAVKKGIEDVKTTVVICPPFAYLSLLNGLTLGAQNVSYEEKGAFVGQVSPSMLKDLGVEYVILGHSDVRSSLAETDAMINKKIKESLSIGLAPVLCVGEKEGEDKNQILETEVTEAFKNISAEEAEKVMIAYEPVWAIGTGKNCSVAETVTSLAIIRNTLSKLYSQDVAEKIKVLYGGSVTSENAASYLEQESINGLLVGGASLKPEEFIKIAHS